MNEVTKQVQKALEHARYRMQNGQPHPDDKTSLQTMQADLDDKIKVLQDARGNIAQFFLLLQGHYT